MIEGYKLPIPGNRPIVVELTARRIRVYGSGGGRLLDCRRTIECAEEVADQLSAQHLVLEANALRNESRRWSW